MMLNYSTLSEVFTSPVRNIDASVELYNSSSTLIDTFKKTDRLISFSIERVGEESKFFGYGVCSKINVKIIDTNREIDISTSNYLRIEFSGYYVLPTYYITEVHRDENTNALSITGYDILYFTSKHTFAELGLELPYTLNDVIRAIISLIGLDVITHDADDRWLVEQQAVNYEGSETIREVLDDLAEATQTVYTVLTDDRIQFKRLQIDEDAVYTIGKADYYTLESGTNRRLATICHATELGDNVSASITESGSTQYVRDNPFWVLREDIADVVNASLEVAGGLTINQFNCEWRGNPLVQIADKIALITKDDEVVYSYLLNDTLTYDGTFSQSTEWHYTASDTETESNPASLGDAIKQTYARVDKANKQIEMMVSDVDINSSNITNLMLNTEAISASVEQVKQVQEDSEAALQSVIDNVNTIASSVEAKMSAEDVQLEIKKELSNGVDKVTTSTGFTFDEEGLTVSKTGSEMETKITEDGMVVYKDSEAVLTANNTGVDAVNLHATTYLIIGLNSRFEDYDGNRTGCFWIGG